MKQLILLSGLFLTVCAGPAGAQQDLPVPGYPAARDVPGAGMLPDPATEHKVVFDAVRAADDVGDVNPMLVAVARYVNTLARYGVPRDKRRIAVVMHRGATPIVLKNEAFKARFDGHDNPNIDLIRRLHAAGVAFHVCGQGASAQDIDAGEILDEVQLDLWALTTMIDLGLKGYVKIGG